MTASATSENPKGLTFAILSCAIPLAFLVWLYHDALHSWFVDDDFAWLTLLSRIHSVPDFLHEMFSPKAQGTIRPWSDRGFFLLLQYLFGPQSLPFRIVTLITAAAAAWMLALVTRRITCNAWAALSASILWLANAALVLPVGWSSAWNQLQCAVFLLAALTLYIRCLETGARRYWWWQLGIFILGFGSLEINVVYPAIALGYLLFVFRRASRRQVVRDIAPLTLISVIYFIVHQAAAQLPAAGPYALRFDSSIWRTCALYLKWSVAPETFAKFGRAASFEIAVVWILAIALAAFAVLKLRKNETTILFAVTWYFATLLPVLPLSEHRSGYYLTLPVMGLAMLGGQAMAWASTASLPGKLLVAIPAALYLWANVPVARAETEWWTQRSRQSRTLVLGTVEARRTHPTKMIVLDGVSNDLFQMTLRQRALIPFGVENVYLSPESALKVSPRPPADNTALDLDSGEMLRALAEGNAVVYTIAGDHLRNITAEFRPPARP